MAKGSVERRPALEDIQGLRRKFEVHAHTVMVEESEASEENGKKRTRAKRPRPAPVAQRRSGSQVDGVPGGRSRGARTGLDSVEAAPDNSEWRTTLESFLNSALCETLAERKRVVWLQQRKVVWPVQCLDPDDDDHGTLRWTQAVKPFGKTEAETIPGGRGLFWWEHGVKNKWCSKGRFGDFTFVKALYDAASLLLSNTEEPLALRRPKALTASGKLRAAEAAWVAQAAEAHQVVWATVKNHPFWPAQIVPREVWTQPGSRLDRSSHCDRVMYFGTLEVASMENEGDSTLSWSEGIRRRLHLFLCTTKNFDRALEEVLSILDSSDGKAPRGWWTTGPPNTWTAEEPSESESSVEDDPSPKERSVPKYLNTSRNIYPADRRVKPLPEENIHVCECNGLGRGWRKQACGQGCMNRAMRLRCHPQACRNGMACLNLPFQYLPRPKLQKKFLGGARGWAIFAGAPIRAGAFIAEYVGEVVSDEECQRRLWESRFNGEKNYYIMELSSSMAIDARWIGGIARFINSSCAPNCEATRWQDGETEETRIGIFAKQNIARGEEITYDYGWQDFGVQQSFKCKCGKEGCRKYLDANPERLRRRGEKVTVDVDGELRDGTVTTYKPQSKNYEVLLMDGATVDIDLDSIPSPGRRSRTKTKTFVPCR